MSIGYDPSFQICNGLGPMKIVVFVSILFIILSCSNRTKERGVSLSTSDSSKKMELKKDSIQRRISVSPDLNFGYPGNNATLEMWKEKVRKEGDPYYYEQLIEYYYEHRDLQDEMVRLTEIMIKHHKNAGGYASLYYSFIKDCNLKNKKLLMKKAITYLKEIDRSKSNCDPLTRLGVRADLAEIYREGIYVKKDTIKAKYYEKLLKKGSRR